MKFSKLLTTVMSEETKKMLWLVILYKCLLEYSFWKVLTIDYTYFVCDFNILKYLNGLFCCLIVFLLIDIGKRQASTFFLFLTFTLQIIPITVVYAMLPLTSPVYYNLLFLSFVLCELIVKHTKPISLFKQYHLLSSALIPIFSLLSLLTVLIIIVQKGLPSLDALNIYNVYILRRENPLELDHYLQVIVSNAVTVFLPVLLVKFMFVKKYFLAGIAALSIFILYLYSGHKTFLFSIILCLVGVFFANKANCFKCFFKTMLLFFSFLSGLTCLFPAYDQVIIFFYDLLLRRMLFVPAILKFYHFDYFNLHPFLVLYGAIPKAINPYLPKYYEDGVVYPFDIGKIYFNAPLMSADTGFFAEVFSRFGYFGFPVLLLLLAFMLIQINAFQNRSSYKVAIGFFIYPIYALIERPVIGSLFFGTWMFLFLLICFYNERDNSDDVQFTSNS